MTFEPFSQMNPWSQAGYGSYGHPFAFATQTPWAGAGMPFGPSYGSQPWGGISPFASPYSGFPALGPQTWYGGQGLYSNPMLQQVLQQIPHLLQQAHQLAYQAPQLAQQIPQIIQQNPHLTQQAPQLQQLPQLLQQVANLAQQLPHVLQHVQSGGMGQFGNPYSQFAGRGFGYGSYGL